MYSGWLVKCSGWPTQKCPPTSLNRCVWLNAALSRLIDIWLEVVNAGSGHLGWCWYHITVMYPIKTKQEWFKSSKLAHSAFSRAPVLSLLTTQLFYKLADDNNDLFHIYSDTFISTNAHKSVFSPWTHHMKWPGCELKCKNINIHDEGSTWLVGKATD